MIKIGTLVAAGTATTNPAPNSLTTSNPFGTWVDIGIVTPNNVQSVSSAWTSQGSAALFPYALKDGQGQIPIRIDFVPSGGAGVTYTVTMWIFNHVSGTWIQPKDNPSFSLTGSSFTYIERPGEDPIFLQLSSISSGTVAIYFDNGLARAQ